MNALRSGSYMYFPSTSTLYAYCGSFDASRLATNEKSKKKPQLIDNALGSMRKISARNIFTFFGENIFLAKNVALYISWDYMVTTLQHGVHPVHPLADMKATIYYQRL